MPHPASTSTLKERAYAQIQRMIEAGELALGTRVSNRKLAKALGMSPIPVREAVTQLVGEGLLEQRAGIGTFVVNPSRFELEDIYELREVLESHAARRAAGVADERGLAAMRQSIDLLRRIAQQVDQGMNDEQRDRLFDQCGLADASFHLAVLHRAGNRLALKTVTGLRLLSRVFSRRAPEDRLRRVAHIVAKHEQILAAIEGHDPRTAAKLMRTHIRAGRRIALKHDDRIRREQMSGSAPSPDAHLLEELQRQIAEM